jgi:DNA-binding protein HU-beta
VNKSQLIDALAARYEGNRKAAAHALDSVLDTITREVARGEKVAITGFGSFEKKVRDARWVRNPSTGARMKSKKKSVPNFKAGAQLKDVVAGTKKLPALTVAAVDRATPDAAKPAVRRTAAAAKRAAGGGTTKKTASKSTAKKSPAKKASGASKSTAKKGSSAAKKSANKSTSTAKKTAKKGTSTAKKSANKSTSAAKKSPAKKSTAKKSPAKKSTAKKTAKKS